MIGENGQRLLDRIPGLLTALGRDRHDVVEASTIIGRNLNGVLRFADGDVVFVKQIGGLNADLRHARSVSFHEAVDAAGRSGFMEVAANHAALLMAQGAGRLLRSIDDRGVVAVLDPRLKTARYGSYIRASMPDFWETTDGDKVRGALGRLVQQPGAR